MDASDEVFERLLCGRAPDGLRMPDGPIESVEVLQMLRDLANSIRPTFAPASWLIVEDGEIVGLCSLIKPPTAEGIDVGYGVAPGRRGRGAATKAISALLDWARRDERVLVVNAETSVENLASHRVLERNNFERTGQRFDAEDGELICWSASAAGGNDIRTA